MLLANLTYNGYNNWLTFQLPADVVHLREGGHLPVDVALHEERLRGRPVRHPLGHRSPAEGSHRRVLQVSSCHGHSSFCWPH